MVYTIFATSWIIMVCTQGYLQVPLFISIKRCICPQNLLNLCLPSIILSSHWRKNHTISRCINQRINLNHNLYSYIVLYYNFQFFLSILTLNIIMHKFPIYCWHITTQACVLTKFNFNKKLKSSTWRKNQISTCYRYL